MNKVKSHYLILTVVVLFTTLNVDAQNWLQPRNTNTSNYLDPTEVQIMGTLSGVLNSKESVSDYQYIPFTFGAW